MAKPTKLFALSSLSMASLFAYSASVQLNDPDWYFWFPLYAFASTVNILNCTSPSKIVNKVVANTALWLGVFLFVKVVIEDFLYELAGFWSLDLGKRVVREKVGSGLVVISMFLQLKASTTSIERLKKKKSGATVNWVEYGMVLLVGFSYGLPVVFYVLLKGD
ncbi:hypothetical protein Syun_015746 [Stephania yunnanensis]|uniref:Transmembrane protein 220 n=1 Tax=Stephania yunnanensis TaxID=152371 RepID=A0AAP0JLS0_9MAGN